MKKWLRITFVSVLCLAFLATTEKPATPAEAQRVELKVAAPHPKGHAALTGLNHLADLVKERSKGGLEIKWAGGPELFKPRDLLEKTGAGIVDMFTGSLGYFIHLAPELGYEALPFDLTFATIPKLTAEMTPIVDKILNKNGAKLVAAATYNLTFHFFTKKPVRKMEDLKGMTMRGHGFIPAKMIEALGATAVVLPSAEVYTALERGVIDGAMYNWPSYMEYMMYETGAIYVVDFVLSFGIGYAVGINLDRYQKLSPELQKILLEAGRDTDKWSVDFWEKEQERLMREGKAKGVKVYTLPPDEAKRWRTTLVTRVKPSFLELKGIDKEMAGKFVDLMEKKWEP